MNQLCYILRSAKDYAVTAALNCKDNNNDIAKVSSLTISADGSTLLARYNDTNLKVWSVPLSDLSFEQQVFICDIYM